MRLDVYLYENHLARSRTEAKNLITEGIVTVNGAVELKPSREVCWTDSVVLSGDTPKYVSRGGYKLEGALSTFGIDVRGRLALDVGASSGGFTDCLLQNGAVRVIAVDSGTGQLHASLRDDPRVFVKEQFNARYMTAESLEYRPSVIVMDVSFISATCIIPSIYAVADEEADFVCLIKPQFEVGRAGVGKNGIVKDESLRKAAIEKVVDCARSVGFELVDHCQSPIKGGDGNVEFLAHFVKGGSNE